MGSVSSGELPAGRVLEGRWEIVRCLATGGMGALYEAVHKGTGKRAAMKVMRPEMVESEELRQRFRQETMVTASIESDHIVGVYDGGTDTETGSPFLVMELLRGHDLHAETVRLGRIEPHDVVEYIRQVSWGLTKAHDAAIVHRDLKPENLFLTRSDDGTPCVKILDFGIAKIIAESMSAAKTTRAIGTPLYMAPEQIRGDGTIGASADLYALGHVAFTLLTGEPYWWGEHVGAKAVYPLLLTIMKGLKEPPTERARSRGVELPIAFDRWFTKAVAPDPLDRHDSSIDLAEELAEVLATAEAPHDAVPPTIREELDMRRLS